METTNDQPDLRCLLTDRIPETSHEFMALPSKASISTIFYTFYWVTAELAHQYKFRSVNRCLLVAEELVLAGDTRSVMPSALSIWLS